MEIRRREARGQLVFAGEARSRDIRVRVSEQCGLLREAVPVAREAEADGEAAPAAFARQLDEWREVVRVSDRPRIQEA